MRGLLFVALLFVTHASAAPFLVCCDGATPTYPSGSALAPDTFTLSFDGKPAVNSAPVTAADGSKQLKFDLGPLNLPAGAHTVVLTAIKNASSNSIGGSSSAINFPFTVGAPAAPVGVLIQP